MSDDDDDDEREDMLAELLDLIRGVGKYRGHGAGLVTRPGEDAEYRMCVELERRGLVRRKASGPDGIEWEARPGLRLHGEDG